MEGIDKLVSLESYRALKECLAYILIHTEKFLYELYVDNLKGLCHEILQYSVSFREWCCRKRHVSEEQEKRQEGGENPHSPHQ